MMRTDTRVPAFPITTLHVIRQATVAVEEYTEGQVIDVKVCEDAKVAGSYAIRATVKPKKGRRRVMDFLVRADQKISFQGLEDAEYTEWPPLCGSLKFF